MAVEDVNAIKHELLVATVDMENVSRHLAEANRLIAASPAWLVQIPNGLMGALMKANDLLAMLNNDRIAIDKMFPTSGQEGGSDGQP